MILTPTQEKVIRDKSRFKVLNWGRRSGKTTVFGYEALGTALAQDKAKVTYYAQTVGDARDIAWDIFLDIFGEAVIHKNETLLEITLRNQHGGESFVSLKGWESVYQAGKGRGTENDLILADEVAFCKQFLEYFDKVLAPTLLTTKGRAVFASTPNGFNHFHELSERARHTTDWSYSHATSYDNPANDPKELERIKNEITEDRFAQEYMADFRKLEGLVYKEFDRQLHVYDGEPTRGIKEYLGGVDFGFRNPAAVTHIKVDSDGHYWVTEEWYKTERVEEQIAEYVKSCGFNEVFPDPENASAIELLNRKGLNVREVVKSKGSVQSGISAVRNLFKQNRIHIHKDCVNLIWELETYAYKEKRPDSNEPEEPIKENDHMCDSLRYVIMTHSPNTGLSDIEKYMLAEARRNSGTNFSR